MASYKQANALHMRLLREAVESIEAQAVRTTLIGIVLRVRRAWRWPRQQAPRALSTLSPRAQYIVAGTLRLDRGPGVAELGASVHGGVGPPPLSFSVVFKATLRFVFVIA